MKTQGCLFILILLFAAWSVAPLQAQDGYAGMPGTYLYQGVGARAMAMGQAYTALAEDGTALYWNPAGLANRDPYQVYFMHSSLFMSTSFDYMAATAPTRRYGNFGLGLVALTSGDFDQRSELNEELGSFGLTDMAFLLSWSKQVFSDIAIGVNYKLVSEKMLDYSGIGHGIDFGARKQLSNWLTAGFSVINLINPRVTLANSASIYPRQLRLGFAATAFNEKVVVSTDFSKIMGWGNVRFNAGVEYHVLQGLDLRAGLNHDRFTMGVGFALNKIGVGYSNRSTPELGWNHLFAVNYAFGGFGVGAEAVPDIFSPVGEQNISKIKLHVKSRSTIDTWYFEILDRDKNVIRTFSQNGELPEEIIWDGRDDKGAFAQDGKFGYRFEVSTADGKSYESSGSLVSISTGGPSGTLGLKNEKSETEEAQNEN